MLVYSIVILAVVITGSWGLPVRSSSDDSLNALLITLRSTTTELVSDDKYQCLAILTNC